MAATLTAVTPSVQRLVNEARELLERGIEHQRKALSSAPARPDYRRPLINRLENLATAQPAEALRIARELAELLDLGFPDDPFAAGIGEPTR